MSTALRTCGQSECERRHYANGLCKAHYERVRLGRPLTGAIRSCQARRSPVCSVDGCEREFEAKGLCALHYARAYRRAARTATIRPQLEELWDRGWLDARAGSVVIQTIAYREYSRIDIDRLANCLADNLMDWNAAIADYLEVAEPGAAR